MEGTRETCARREYTAAPLIKAADAMAQYTAHIRGNLPNCELGGLTTFVRKYCCSRKARDA